MKSTDDLRTVCGVVLLTGTVPSIVRGTGDFAIVRTGAGLYTIRFTPPFLQLISFVGCCAELGALVLTEVTNPGAADFINVNTTVTTTGVNGDHGFAFIATGLGKR